MKGRRTICILIGFLIFISPAFGTGNSIKRFHACCSNPAMEGWNRTYGGEMDDRGYAIADAGDGYLLGGLTLSYGKGNGDAYLVRVDEDGNEMWERVYGGSEEDGIYDILKIENAFILAGKTESFGHGGYDAWLLEVDEEGNEIWNKTYGGEKNEVAYSICRTTDGYIIAGITESFGHGGYDAWLLKVDKEGNEIWNKTYGGELGDYIYSIEEVTAGYVMAGTKMTPHLDYDAWLLKVDKEGNEIWEKTYGGAGDEIAADASFTGDGYVIAGNLLIFEEQISDAFIIKTDGEGNEIWNNTYGGAYMDTFNSIMAINDGYVAAGFYGLLSKRGGGWIVGLDENGDITWNKTIGGKTGDDHIWEFIKIGEEYILVGSSTTYSKGGYDVWLIKASRPQLEIDIQGGFGITILIKNDGNETLYNLEFGVDIGGLVFMGRHMEGEISSLPPGISIEVHIFTFGIGGATIRVRAGEIYKTANLFIMGPLVMVEGA